MQERKRNSPGESLSALGDNVNLFYVYDHK